MNIPDVLIEQFVSADEKAKLVLQGAWLDVESERLLATNGHIAARVGVSLNEKDVTGPIPLEVFQLARKELKAIRKVMKESLPDPWLRVSCGASVIEVENLLTNTLHIVTRTKLSPDDTFPKIDSVFPSLAPSATICLSRDYVKSVMAALDGDVAAFWVSASDKQVIIAAAEGKASIAIMPIRTSLSGVEVEVRGIATEVAQ